MERIFVTYLTSASDLTCETLPILQTSQKDLIYLLSLAPHSDATDASRDRPSPACANNT